MTNWNKEDLSTYNHADSPWYDVSMNGKVDIGTKIGGGDTKIGLHSKGMYKLVYEWLKSNNGLSEDEKKKLIDLLK